MIIKTILRAACVAPLAFAAFTTVSSASDTGSHSGHGMAKHGQLKPGTAKLGDLTIDAAWTRQTPPGAKVAGGYLTITNNGTEADRLIGGKAEFAGRVEIHQMAVTAGVMRMAKLADGLEIGPGDTAELEPGSFHVMFMDISESPMEGNTVPVTLTFAKAGDVQVMMPVAAIGASSPSGTAGRNGHGHSDVDHSGHSDMKHGEMKKLAE